MSADAAIRAAVGAFHPAQSETYRAIWDAACEQCARAADELDAAQEAERKASPNYSPWDAGWKSPLAKRCADACRALKSGEGK
jgi:hypothetical protein